MDEQQAQHTPDYRTVAIFWTSADAEVARALLHADGIPAAFLETGEAPLLPGLGSSPIRLLVPHRDLDRARELLGDAAMPADPAPAGGQPGRQAALWSPWMAVALAALAGFGALFALSL